MIKDLTVKEFNAFQKDHPLSNYCQTVNYGILMGEFGYHYDLIGYFKDDSLLAASLILIKGIKNLKYGYAPKGFLIDYKDYDLLSDFTDKLKDFYYEKEVAFIKINPEIVIGEVDLKTKVISSNPNIQIENFLEALGYNKLKKNLYFESLFPRFNAFINLKKYSSKSVDKNTRNKIKKGFKKGLVFEKAKAKDLELLNKFKNHKSFYYKDLYNVYSKTKEVDVFKITIDFEKYLINSQNLYIQEHDHNQELNLSMMNKATTRKINRKMNSDLSLLAYKKDIMEATKLMQDEKNDIIALAIVVKHNNFIRIIESAYNKRYKRYVPNYFLFHNIIKHYRKDFDYIELNGLSGDFSDTSPYRGLNNFKLGFNPNVYEFIGEYDLIIEPNAYNHLIKTGALAKEFKK